MIMSRLWCRALPLAFASLLALRAARPQSPETTKVVTPALDFSGVIYANYQYRSDSATRAANGGKPGSKFDVERVYLNFRMPAGDRASIRVTADIFNNGDAATNGYYKGWIARFKYAYLQLNVSNDLAGVKGLGALMRFGMLHTVVIDHEEGFWPRYLGQVAIERNGFFSSADVGAAVAVTLPHRWGEVYGTITNGPGYTASESDRFKDVALRVSLTPFANREALGGWLNTLTVSPWAYAGQTASKFQNGGVGQVGGVSDGLARNRYGLFVGNKDRRLAFGLDYARRTETAEGGTNTATSPRTTTDVTGKVTSVFAIARPAAWKDVNSRSAIWGIIARCDEFKPDDTKGPANRFTTYSLFWEPTPRVTVSLDVQHQARKRGSTTPESNVLFLHWQALF